MGWARASSITRSLNCPASVYLPHSERPAGPAAEWGHAIHTVKEGRDPGRKDARRWRDSHEPFFPRADLWPGGRHERGLGLLVGIADHGDLYQVLEAWEGPAEDRWGLLPRPIGQGGPDSDWATGAVDWYTTDGPVLWVDDLKTGKDPEPPPTDQLTFYATALARVLDTSSDVLTSITHWPRYPLGRGPVRSTALITLDDRRVFENELSAAKARADDHEPARPGPWCTYCPCMTCPSNPAKEP